MRAGKEDIPYGTPVLQLLCSSGGNHIKNYLLMRLGPKPEGMSDNSDQGVVRVIPEKTLDNWQENLASPLS